MANNVCYVLLILWVTCLDVNDAFLQTSMPCPSNCLDSTCTLGLGCQKCRGGYLKFYAGTYIGFICLYNCRLPYIRDGEYCLPTLKNY